MPEEQNGFLLQEEKAVQKRLRLLTWWVEHRLIFKRIGISLFIAFDAFFILFALWRFLDAYAISFDSERKSVEALVLFGQSDLRNYSLSRSAAALEEEDLRVFSLSDNRYDFFARIENPNHDWYAQVTYKFVYSGGETAEKTTFVLPSQRKVFSELAVESPQTISGALLKIVSVDWHRVNRHSIADYEVWSDERIDFEFIEPQFGTVRTDNQTVGQITFDVLNRSAYGYYEPTFYVLLKRGNAVVGVSEITLTSIDAGESRSVSAGWFGLIPQVTSLEIVPDINLFDEKSYKALEGERALDIRARVQ